MHAKNTAVSFDFTENVGEWTEPNKDEEGQKV
jgi:hypothetical protein